MFAANDGLANSAINAVEAAGFGPIPVSGQDATAEGMQNIALGKQTVSVYKPIQDEVGVAAAIALALRAARTTKLPRPATSHRWLRAARRSTIIGINTEDGSATDRRRATTWCHTSPWSLSV